MIALIIAGTVVASSSSFASTNSSIHVVAKIPLENLRSTSGLLTAYDASDKYVYVANNSLGSEPGSVVIINAANQIVKSVSLRPVVLTFQILFVPKSGEIWVSGRSSNNYYIDILSGLKLRTVVPIGNKFDSAFMAYDPGNGYVYVSQYRGLYVFDGETNKLVATLNFEPSGSFSPNSVAYAPVDQGMYVASDCSCDAHPFVSVVEGAKVVKNISVNYRNVGPLSYDPANKDIYAMATTYHVRNGENFADSEYALIINPTSNKIINTITVAHYPKGCAQCYYSPGFTGAIVFNPSNRNMYVEDYTPQAQLALINVTMIDSFTNRVENVWSSKMLEAGTQMIYDASNHYIYVPLIDYFQMNTLIVLNPSNHVVASFDFYKGNFGNLGGSVFDPTNDYVYIVAGMSDVYVFS